MPVLNPSDWSLLVVIVVFALAAAAITFLGSRLARVADRLADVTGLGEAVFGAVLLGGATSLGGMIVSITAAWQELPRFAFSNSIGGIAAQTTFLAVADMVYRRANLEHAAASHQNVMQGALLCTLLAVPLLVMAGPEFTLWGIHPASLALFGAYWFGVRLVHRAGARPLWVPRETAETREDVPHEEKGRTPAWRLWLAFGGLAAGAALAGYSVATSGIEITRRTGLSETVVGAFMTAVATSTPELVVSIAAVRRGALTLAVGNIIGGNSFDVVTLVLVDAAYRPGSLYHAVGLGELYLVALGIVLTGVLLLGLLRREERGVGNIGFESVLVLVLYAMAVVVLVPTM